MLQMHSRQQGFTYSACGPLTKNKEKIQKPKETRNSRYIYQNKLDKACFQYDIAYRDFNVLSRRTTFEIAKNPKYHEYQHEHASMVQKFFDKKSSGASTRNN